jgi:hypothetical protein
MRGFSLLPHPNIKQINWRIVLPITNPVWLAKKRPYVNLAQQTTENIIILNRRAY